MALVFETFNKSLLPSYIKENDSYKNLSQEGFVERFMGALGQEWDAELYQQIEDTIQLIDPFTAPVIYLDYIAQTLGIPDLSQNDNHYRRILGFIVSIYKIKGTVQSFKSIFYTLSFTTVLTEIPVEGLIYDEVPPIEYDDGISKYDDTCLPCTEYDIEFTPKYDGLIEDELDAATGWTLDGSSSISGGVLTAVGVTDGEASKDFALEQSTNYTMAIEINSITGGGVRFLMSNDETDLVVANAYVELTTIPITVAGVRYFNFTTNADANQSLLVEVNTNGQTVVIEKIRFWKTDTSPNAIMTASIFERIQLLISLVEPINAKIRNLIYDGDIITAVFIQVDIDSNGDLIYDNTADPDLVLTMVSGQLIISGPLADRYFLQDGQLYFTTLT